MNEYVQRLINEVNNPIGKLSIEDYRIPDELLGIVKEVGEINSKLNLLEIIEPTNFNKMRDDWVFNANRGIFTNPVFDYDSCRLRYAVSFLPKIKETRSLLYGFEPKNRYDEFSCDMLQLVIEDVFATIKIAESILKNDDFYSGHFVRQKYGVSLPPFFQRHINFSVRTSDFHAPLKNKAFDAEEIKKVFSLAEKEYGFDWPICISETAAAIDVRDKSSLGSCIVIPSSRVVNYSTMLRLIGHEIESHLRISENGKELFGLNSFDLRTDDESLYEGLAILSDMDFDLWARGEFSGPLPWYLEAIELAQNGKTFAEVAAEIYKQRQFEIDPVRKTFNTVYRVFRGITNTENRAKYAFTKDAYYFIGFSLAKELRDEGYEWLLELGSFSRAQLMLIAKTFKLSPDLIPHKRLDLKLDESFREIL